MISADKFTWREGDLTHVDAGRRYTGPRTGDGRWAVIDGVGVVWTNNVDGASIGPLPSWVRDDNAANSIARRFKDLASNTDLTAGQAFDVILSDYRSVEIQSGDIGALFTT